MRRPFIVKVAFVGVAGVIPDLTRQRSEQLFQLVYFSLLFIDNLVEGIDTILLVCQLQFDLNQAFFNHQVSPYDALLRRVTASHRLALSGSASCQTGHYGIVRGEILPLMLGILWLQICWDDNCESHF
jgi:hypothetical protein